MDKAKAAADILAEALKLAPSDGWNQPMLGKAALIVGYKKTDAIRVFPSGATDAIDYFDTVMNDTWQSQLAGYSLDSMKIRERIALLVRLRITVYEPHREALRRAIAQQALFFNLPHALHNLYKTVDNIWFAAGDRSTDFNFYSKRLMLAGIYTTTLSAWLEDKSPGYNATWEFLDRRIEDVMKIEKAKYQLKQWIAK